VLGNKLPNVIPGLVPGIHVRSKSATVDGRDKPGHDDGMEPQFTPGGMMRFTVTWLVLRMMP
jgi:hypothetical protein